MEGWELGNLTKLRFFCIRGGTFDDGYKFCELIVGLVVVQDSGHAAGAIGKTLVF